MNLTDIRAGLMANLATVQTVRVYSEWPDTPNFPAVCIISDEPYIEPHMTFGDTFVVKVNLIVAVIVSKMPDVARAQQNLDRLLSYDLPNAVQTSITLGGEAEQVSWVGTSGLKEITIQGVGYLGHEMSIETYARAREHLMTVGSFTSGSVLIGTLDATPFTSEVASPLTRAMNKASTIASGGFDLFVPGMKQGEMTITGFQDYAAGGFFEKINTANLGSSTLVSIITPTVPGAAVAVGDPALFMRGPLDQIDADSAPVGQIIGTTVHVVNDLAPVMGSVIHPNALRSTTASGTAFAMTGPTASQILYAGLHVTGGSGGNLTVRVQTDDAVGFPSATTRITFATVTGVSNQMLSLTPVNISTETHIRADWTISAGSFTFAVVCGIVPV